MKIIVASNVLCLVLVQIALLAMRKVSGEGLPANSRGTLPETLKNKSYTYSIRYGQAEKMESLKVPSYRNYKYYVKIAQEDLSIELDNCENVLVIVEQVNKDCCVHMNNCKYTFVYVENVNGDFTMDAENCEGGGIRINSFSGKATADIDDNSEDFNDWTKIEAEKKTEKEPESTTEYETANDDSV